MLSERKRPYRGVEQSVARWAHNPEVAGSSPAPATTVRARLAVRGFFLLRAPRAQRGKPFPFWLRALRASLMTRLRDLFANLPRFRAAMGSPYGGRFRCRSLRTLRWALCAFAIQTNLVKPQAGHLPCVSTIHYKNLCTFAANSAKRQTGFPHKADAHGKPCAKILSYFASIEA